MARKEWSVGFTSDAATNSLGLVLTAGSGGFMPGIAEPMAQITSVALEAALKDALERHLGNGAESASLNLGSTPGDSSHLFGSTPANLAESIRYSLLAPGKRIRPRLMLACAEMVGLEERAALPAALALEMIHCFTLIHDDLPCMDDDDFRRGRPSNHKVFGEAVALLAGDALMMVALETFMDSAPFVGSEHFVKALRRFAWATGPRGVMGGQAAESLLGANSSLAELERMHAMKTGALFSAALLIPKDLAGVPDQSVSGSAPRGESLDRFAAELGIAFQIADDLDDAKQDLAKGVAVEAQKPTSILHYVSVEEARKSTRDRLESATQALGDAWGEAAAASLTRIAREVLATL